MWRKFLSLFGVKEDPPDPIPDPNVTYRQHEKAKALLAMSVAQRVKAEALGEGDVSDLEMDGHTAVIIMEATANVYEWDGFDWVDRYPNR